jgi:hypothetical protein
MTCRIVITYVTAQHGPTHYKYENTCKLLIFFDHNQPNNNKNKKCTLSLSFLAIIIFIIISVSRSKALLRGKNGERSFKTSLLLKL